MNMNESTGSNMSGCHRKCISWSAIILGALVGIGLNFLLNLFCVAIGLTAFTLSSEGIITLMVGGFLGLTLATIVAMFTAGWIAGALGRPHCSDVKMMGELYGFAVWCVALVLMVLLTSQTNALIISTNNNLNPNIAGSTVQTTSDRRAPTVNVERSRSRNGANHSTITVNPEKSVNALGMTTFATFFLFFIGALASCFGGHCGMSCCNKKCESVK